MKFILSVLAILIVFQVYASDFTDNDLDKLLSNSSQGIIYIWNPYMPLSQIGRDEAIEIAKELGIDCFTLIVGQTENYVSLDAQLNSYLLFSLGVMNHFPAIVLYKNEKIIENIIFGYEQKTRFTEMIKYFLNGDS